MKLHQLKLEAHAASSEKNSKISGSSASSQVETTKLPKIEIDKFCGSPLHWPRFWGQFSETVDKSSVAPVNKFAYLCGFLTTKVKAVIEDLPFTSKRYQVPDLSIQQRNSRYNNRLMSLSYLAFHGIRMMTPFGFNYQLKRQNHQQSERP